MSEHDRLVWIENILGLIAAATERDRAIEAAANALAGHRSGGRAGVLARDQARVTIDAYEAHLRGER